MDLAQFKNVLDAVSQENCNKNNIIEKIKQESQRRYFDFYQGWKRNNFNIDHKICINRGSNIVEDTTLSHLAIDCEREDIVDLLIVNGASVNAIKNEYNSDGRHNLHYHLTDAYPGSEIMRDTLFTFCC
ncbi:MAG: hypothetical protein ACR5KV_05785 [Wolbachia sp.]